MPIDVACSCGRHARVKDELAGKRAKCPVCGIILTIPAAEIDAEEAAARALLEDDEPAPAPAAHEPPEREAPQPSRAAPRTKAADPPPPARKKIGIEYKVKESSSAPARITISPGVAGALGLILLGGILIAIRLANDRVPIYGVILVAVGLFRLVAGLMGKEEE